MTKGKRICLYLFVLILVALYIVIYTIPNVSGALRKTEILQYGNVQVTDEATCYVVRNEKVYLATNSGSINYYIMDGVQVRKGTQVVEVIGGSVATEETRYGDIVTRLGVGAVKEAGYKAQGKGVVSYFVDGYEEYFTVDKIKELSYDKVKNLPIEVVNLVRNDTLNGEPLFKICDNGSWYMVCFIKSGNISKYEIGSRVTVNLPLGDVACIVQDIIDKGDMWMVVLKSNCYYEDFGRLRKQKATIVTSDYSGIIIDNESIASNEDKIGVFVKSKNGEYAFTPIEIIARDGDKSIAKVQYYYDEEGKRVDTVEIYDEILRKPQ